MRIRRNWITDNIGWVFCEIAFRLLDADIEEDHWRFKLGEWFFNIGNYFYSKYE